MPVERTYPLDTRRSGDLPILVLIEVSSNVQCQPVGRLITAGPIFFQRLHRDPVEIPTQGGG